MSTTTRSGRREWLAISVLTLLGAVIRFWDAGRLGILHFDEGMYALSGFWINASRGLASLDPSIAFYAPPVIPTLIGLMYLLFGISDTSALLVSLLFGTLTIPTAAWLARRVFGPGAGVCAAALVACYGPQVAFSRVALTDATFLTSFLLALILGIRLLDQPGLARTVGFGLAVGLAQLTKYNGFLAGVAVAAAALLPLWNSRPGSRVQVLRTLVWVAAGGGIALAVYYPWYQFVQTRVPGGYPALVQHHRGYLSPISRWPLNALTQWAEAITLAGRCTGPFSWLLAAWPLAWACTLLVSGKPQIPEIAPPTIGSRSLWLALPAGAMTLGLLPDLTWWLMLAAIPVMLLKLDPAPRVLGTAGLILTILTPLYHPYARLALPFNVLSQILLAGWMVTLWQPPESTLGLMHGLTKPKRWCLLAGALLFPLLLRPLAGAWPIPAPGLLAPSDGLRWLSSREEAKGALNAVVPERVYLFGRPSLLYYLRLGGQAQVIRVGDEAGLNQIGPPPVGASSGRERVSVIVDGAVLGPDSLLKRPPWSIRSPGQRNWNQGNWVTLLDLDPGLALRPDTSRVWNQAPPSLTVGAAADRLAIQTQIFVFRNTESKGTPDAR